jgi:penicillin-binding protein activator
MKRAVITILALALCLSSIGCASRPHVSYGDPGSTEAVSTDFGSNDLQQIASSMVDSLLTFPPVVEATAKRRPVLVVDHVKNKTRQHIDTEGVTDTIRTKLIRSGKFRFIDRTTDDAAIDEIRTQQESGLTNQRTAIKFGKQFGAEYMLTGSIMDIPQRAGDITDVYYKFTLNLKNLTTGILEWADEKEIRKTAERPLFGR